MRMMMAIFMVTMTEMRMMMVIFKIMMMMMMVMEMTTFMMTMMKFVCEREKAICSLWFNLKWKLFLPQLRS